MAIRLNGMSTSVVSSATKRIFPRSNNSLKEILDRPFLIVRFGDHQPYIARDMWEPSKSADERVRSMAKFARQYFTTYYAVETMNFAPKAALPDVDRLDATYLGAVIATLAGLPLDEIQKGATCDAQPRNGEFYDFDNG